MFSRNVSSTFLIATTIPPALIDLDMRLPFQILSERFYLPRPWLILSCWSRKMTEYALLQHGQFEDLEWRSKRTKHGLCKWLFSTFPTSSSTSYVSCTCSIVERNL